MMGTAHSVASFYRQKLRISRGQKLDVPTLFQGKNVCKRPEKASMINGKDKVCSFANTLKPATVFQVQSLSFLCKAGTAILAYPTGNAPEVQRA